jgi:hypothetical protein
MRSIRQSRAWLVAGWLLAQAAFATATPLGLCVAAGVAPAGECTCSHEDGRPCPMHPDAHKSAPSCSCRSTTDPAAIIMASLVGPSAVLPDAMAVARPQVLARPLIRLESSPISAASTPDAPPPRE